MHPCKKNQAVPSASRRSSLSRLPSEHLRMQSVVGKDSCLLPIKIRVKEDEMFTYVLALLIGIVSGLRAMTPLAVVSWAAHARRLPLENTWLAFLGFAATPWILTVLAIGELIADKLPKTPSRKAPAGFIGRILTGSICGAAIGASTSSLAGGLIMGAIGSVIGTYGGYEFRRRLVAATGGKDLPIALLEDAIAIGGAIWIVSGV